MTVSLTLEGVKSVDDVNRVTTALMEIEGVESAEVAREWAQVEGQVKASVLIQAIERLGFNARR